MSLPPPRGDPHGLGRLKDAERHIAPRGTFRENKKPNMYQGYLIAMSTIIQNEPSSFEDVVKQQVWKDAMNEEYESIMKMMFGMWSLGPKTNRLSLLSGST